MSLSIRSPLTPLRFQGAVATRLAQKYWLSDVGLDAALKRDKDPYIGTLPSEITSTLGLPEQPILAYLDTLSDQIRLLPERQGWLGALKNLVFGKPVPAVRLPGIKLSYEAQGVDGFGYKLKVGSQTYMLKVAQPYKIPLMTQEIATGYHLTHTPIRDLCRLYTANPHRGWMLMEFVTEEDNPDTRYGKSLAEAPVCVTDDHPGNRIGQMRVDYGGLMPKNGRYEEPRRNENPFNAKVLC